MTVTSINLSSPVDAGGANPLAVTKRDLETMRDHLTKTGGDIPSGLDTLIEKFDQAAGKSGQMSVRQFRAFAAENGVAMPGSASAASGVIQSSGAGLRSADTGGQGASPSTASTPGRVDDVSFTSEGELKIRATQGDMRARHQLELRALARGEAPAALD